MNDSTDRWDDANGSAWDDANDEVYPAFQLSYGHVIVEKQDIDILRKRIEKLFHLPAPICMHDTLDSKYFPQKNHLYSLRDDETLHFLYFLLGNYVFVYGSYEYFYNNRLWIKMSRECKALLALCLRLDASEFAYLIFNKGKLCLDLHKDDRYKTTYIEKGFQVSLNQGKKTIGTYEFNGFTEEDEVHFMPDSDLCLCQKGADVRVYDLGRKTYLDVTGTCMIKHVVYSTARPASFLQKIINKLNLFFGYYLVE